MPAPAHLTPRQLRTIADRVEQLTTARLNNQAMGVPTTPNRFECRFPSGHRGTVTWAEAQLTSAAATARNNGRPVSRYVVELHIPEAASAAEQMTAAGTPIGPGIVGLTRDPDQDLARAERLRAADQAAAG